MSRLSEDQINEIETKEPDELKEFIAANERKRRRIIKDQKAYAATCRDFAKELEEKTEKAIECLDVMEQAAGIAPPPSPVPIVPFPKEGRKPSKAKAPAKLAAVR